MGFRLANLVLIDCERTLSENPLRLSRVAKASRGIVMRDMVERISAKMADFFWERIVRSLEVWSLGFWGQLRNVSYGEVLAS